MLLSGLGNLTGVFFVFTARMDSPKGYKQNSRHVDPRSDSTKSTLCPGFKPLKRLDILKEFLKSYKTALRLFMSNQLRLQVC